MTFGNWMQSQINDRGWTQRELSRRSGVSQAQISNFINGSRKPTADACQRLAQALEHPLDTVLREAGILTSSGEDDPTIAETVELMRNMPPNKKRLALNVLKTIFHDRGDVD